MKKLLLAIILLFSTATYCQINEFEKGAELIIIPTKFQNIDSAMVYASNKLLDAQVLPETIDYKIGFIVTKPFEERESIDIKYILRFKHTSNGVDIILRGVYFFGTGIIYDNVTGWDPIKNIGMKGSPAQIVWNNLIERAKGLSIDGFKGPAINPTIEEIKAKPKDPLYQ